MYTTILCFLIAVTIHVLAPSNPKAVWSADGVGLMVAVFAVTWLLVRSRMKKLTRAALSEERRAQMLRPAFTRVVQDHQTLLLAPFAFFTYATDYNSLVVLPAMKFSQAAGGLCGLAPYIAMWIILWWEAYPLKSVLFGPGDTRYAFVKAHSRMEAAAVAPWFVLLALGDLFAILWPTGAKFLDTHPLAQLFYAPVFLTIAAIFMPVLVKRIWGCKPVPPGPLRDRLEADVKALGLPVREILFWPLLGGRLITAGIVGPAPRYRYLLITPALASILDADEMASVIAHEAGHVKYNHLWFYLLFFSGLLVGGLTVFFQLSSIAIAWWSLAFPEASGSEWAGSALSVAMTVGMGFIIFFGFRILFGALSRAFERQADLYSLEAMGRPGPIASALESISAHSGDIRDLPSWHHGSVAERVRYVSAAALDPALGLAHHRKVRWLKRTSIAAILFLFAGAATLQLPKVSDALHFAALEQGATSRVTMHPDEWRTWSKLGDIRLQRGREAEALEAYLNAARANPSDYNSLNNAAWLMATGGDPAIRNPADALRLATRAAMLMPAPYVLDTLAEAQEKTGDLAGAIATLERAISETTPEDPGRPALQEKLDALRKKLPPTPGDGGRDGKQRP